MEHGFTIRELTLSGFPKVLATNLDVVCKKSAGILSLGTLVDNWKLGMMKINKCIDKARKRRN